MKQDSRVRKRCDVCGHETWAARLDRACRQKQRSTKTGFTTGYRCPGALRLVQPRQRRRKADGNLPPIPKGLCLGHVLTEEYQQQVNAVRGDKWRGAALRALTRAEKRHKAAAQDAAAAEKRMRKWTREIRRQQARAAMSDDEVEQVRARAAKAAQVSHVKRRLAKSAGVNTKKEEQ